MARLQMIHQRAKRLPVEVRHELLAMLRTFRFTKKNNRPQKLILWVFLSLYGFGVIGILTGILQLDTADKVGAWSTIATGVGVLWGRVWAKEVR